MTLGPTRLLSGGNPIYCGHMTHHQGCLFCYSFRDPLSLKILKRQRSHGHELGWTVAALGRASNVITREISSLDSNSSPQGLSGFSQARCGVTPEFTFPPWFLRGPAQAKYNLNNLQESCAVLLSAVVFENCLQS